MTAALQSAIQAAGPAAVDRTKVMLLLAAQAALEAGAAANLLLIGLADALQRSDTDGDGPVAHLVGHAVAVGGRQPGAVERVLAALRNLDPDPLAVALAAELALAATEGARQVDLMDDADLATLDDIMAGRTS